MLTGACWALIVIGSSALRAHLVSEPIYGIFLQMVLVSLRREDGSIGKEAKLKTAVQLQDFLDVVVVVNAEFAGTCLLHLRRQHTSCKSHIVFL